MLHGRTLAIAGLVAVAIGVGAAAVGCANGTPTVDEAFTGAGDDGGTTPPPPQGDGGSTPPPPPGGGDAGCRQKSDCPDGVCDTARGVCVGCVADGDCPAGKVCDPATKTCAPGCSAGHVCDTGKTCCSGACVATNTVQACSGCGLACDTAHSTGPSCNGTTCAYTGCGAGFGDCKTAAPDTDGCETPLNTPTDCGGCGRACSTANVNGTPTCTAGGACNSACKPNFGNCNLPVVGPDGGVVADDGCESNLTTCAGTACCGTLCGKHDNGQGQTYVDCQDPLGTPGSPATYNSRMAAGVVTSFAGANSTSVGGNCFNLYSCAAAKNTNTGECMVWCYTGIAAGYMHHDASSCVCPADTNEPKWN